ncbi:hypothetical protein [Paenibacillus vini]|uniref:Nuclear transport factor 2 family protein n=1 Tax=Paenibacillus vini TaxID=1476024 RepID=A0ABQ4MCM0_9BACL|nr:hypothetical protein [Paenibacillus vini]GIP53743.1 hypothetical protein J42TS3_27780 [Paenibacillus vini]
MTNRNLLIKFNRFSINEVLAEWEKADKSKEVIVLESATSDWSIEVDGIQSISHQIFETFLSKLDDFDNEVQLFCKETYEKSNYGIEKYMVTLEWISILENSITMGYWGEHVNVELRAVIEYENGMWKQKEIYYQ